jgi:hypothetical protein
LPLVALRHQSRLMQLPLVPEHLLVVLVLTLQLEHCLLEH